MSAKSKEQMIEAIGNMTVFELADLVKEMEDKFGVSAAMPVAAAPVAGGVAGEVAEEKSEFKVTLKDIGSEKIKVIKALRKVVEGLSLSDAKAAVEGAPSVIAESASKDDAKQMKEELEAAGAKVELS
jgi:large subunit ribosomal protein L7/L12